MTNINSCKKCVTPKSDDDHLDSDGICQLCNSQERLGHITQPPDITALNEIIENIRAKGKDRDYDCIVAWSGGRDSTHMLYQLVREHKLRCAAIFGITPFTPIEIIENVRSISKQLGVKLIEFHTPKGHIDIARFCLTEYSRSRDPIMLNLACASCKYTNKEIFGWANKLKIATVIYGGNRFEYIPTSPAAINISTNDRYSFSAMLLDSILRLVKGVRTIIKNPRILIHSWTFFGATFLYINQYSLFLRLKFPQINRFDYFHFADWDLNDVENTLEKLNWKLPEGCVSTWRADCTFEAVKNAAFKSALGFTCSHAMYSNLIRAGKMSRNDAINRLSKEPISETRLKSALKTCGLDEDSLR